MMEKISFLFFKKMMIFFDISSNEKSLKIGQNICYRKETSGGGFRTLCTYYVLFSTINDIWYKR